MTLSNQKYLFLLIKYTFSCVMCVVANYVENSMAYYLKAIVHEPHLTTPLACVPFFFHWILLQHWFQLECVFVCTFFYRWLFFVRCVFDFVFLFWSVVYFSAYRAYVHCHIIAKASEKFQWINDVRRFNVFITNATLSIDCVDGQNVIGYVSMITMCRSVTKSLHSLHRFLLYSIEIWWLCIVFWYVSSTWSI